MATPPVPPQNSVSSTALSAQAAAPTPPSVNTQELAFWIRNWVHYDNLASSLYRQTTNARRVRDEFENKILQGLRASNMENAVIQIAGGRLVVHEERHNQALTLGRMEELLHGYFLSKHGSHDDTQNIMKYMRKQRGYEVVKRLKKQTGPAPPPLPPPPTDGQR